MRLLRAELTYDSALAQWTMNYTWTGLKAGVSTMLHQTQTVGSFAAVAIASGGMVSEAETFYTS